MDVNEKYLQLLVEREGYSFNLGLTISFEELVIKIIKTNNLRLIKSLPFLIYNSSPPWDKYPDKRTFNLAKCVDLAKKYNVIDEINAILFISIEICKRKGIENAVIKVIQEFKFPAELKRLFFGKANKKLIEKYKDIYLTFEEYFNEFETQQRIYREKLRVDPLSELELKKKTEFNYALNTLFKPKQVEIIKKVINRQPLKRYEYNKYSSVIKKRLKAVSLLNGNVDGILSSKPVLE